VEVRVTHSEKTLAIYDKELNATGKGFKLQTHLDNIYQGARKLKGKNLVVWAEVSTLS
jgi:hypothetical protein